MGQDGGQQQTLNRQDRTGQDGRVIPVEDGDMSAWSRVRLERHHGWYTADRTPHRVREEKRERGMVLDMGKLAIVT